VDDAEIVGREGELDDAEIVGREGELQAIFACLEQTAAADGIVIEGEAGIGKTTLCRAAVRRAADDRSEILETRPSAVDASESSPTAISVG